MKPSKKKLLTDYRNHFSNKDILSVWNISPNTLYKLIGKLNLPKAPRTNNKKPVKEKTITSIPVSAESPQPKVVQAEPTYKENGFMLAFNGEQTAENIIKRLEKINVLLMEEEADFEISLSIKELIKN